VITLYQREGCPWCQPVRQLLTDLQVSYFLVNVPKTRDERTELIATTSSKFIPALVDDGVVIAGRLEDNSHVLAYLVDKFGAGLRSAHPDGANSCDTRF
jgi:glutathione S-transferase